MKTIKKILVANRGEVALRINATCHALGIQTVGVYAPEDAFLSYVYQLDQVYPLSGSGLSAYLNQEEILSIALQTGSDAIHPGYGFLSENAQFARNVINAGIIWIGPDPKTLELTAHKSYAKDFVAQCGLPVVPGYALDCTQGREKLIEQAHVLAQQAGYPVILKDPLAGGGKAMRLVPSADKIASAIESVLRESQKLTGSGQLVIEKYLKDPRHIEVQIMGDGHNAIHLYERECSLQRRHQKIVEEAPCQFIAQNTKDQLFDAAITIAKKLGYKGAGTVEFLVLPDQSFYFLEINPRLQVEHAVTEIITGQDIVALQIEIAQTGKLPIKQADITPKMHAIECRIYSEDPANNFFPSTGRIALLGLPHGPFVRHEHDLSEGALITSDFDPMLSKLITFGPDRVCATGHMREALRNFTISGLSTNILFLRALLRTSDFVEGAFSTQYLHDKAKVDQILSGHQGCDPQDKAQFSQDELAVLVALLAEVKFVDKKTKTGSEKKRWKRQAWK